MVEPAKPFACTLPDCGMTFTNEDHLHVHTKKHDMILQLGLEQKAAFVADQTPTPTRFIRNCEEVGLFQDLTVNPFEEGFKRAMETYKHGSLLESTPSSTSDDLHTPQMVFPMIDPDSTLYTTNNQRNITISRSSSDESGTIKEYETTTISKLTNEVTTISRIVNKHDILDKIHPTDDALNKNDDLRQKDMQETSVSFTNNVIKIHNNIEIRKDNLINIDTAKTVPNLVAHTDTVIKDTNSVTTKDVLLVDVAKTQMPVMPPIMSQKSLDFVVDCLTSDLCKDEIKKPSPKPKRKIAKPKSPVTKNDQCVKEDDYEVIIKLPNGKQVKMKAVEEVTGPDKDTQNDAKEKNIETDTKEKLKLAINNKVQKHTVITKLPAFSTPVHSILPTGTLIPVTIVSNAQLTKNISLPLNNLAKVPIAPLNPLLKPNQEFKKTVKRKSDGKNSASKTVDSDEIVIDDDDDDKAKKTDDFMLSSRVAASRRYRLRLRETMRTQVAEIKQLREANQRLAQEKAVLQVLITEHMKQCPNAEHLRVTQEKLATSKR